MQDFSIYFGWGWEHIISRDALDHILFIAALAVVFQLRQWKGVLILVTAFTIGHFLTLWLSVTDRVRVADDLVELLIPITIVLTALSNFLQLSTKLSMRLHYALALGFGLVHGMGYANAIRFSLSKGQSLGWGLLGFNIGLEFGQLLVVGAVLLAGYVAEAMGLKCIWWVRGMSSLIFFIAFYLAVQRIPH